MKKQKTSHHNPLPAVSSNFPRDYNPQPSRSLAPGSGYVDFEVVRRAKQGASCQVKDLMFQNLASRNYRVLQLC